MKLKSVMLMAVALGCGLVAMLGVQQALSGNKGDGADGNQSQVLVAAAEIVPGSRLTDENATFKAWPKDSIPQGAVTKPEDYEQRALKVRTYPGEIIMKAKLGKKGEFGAASDIPEGQRVISVAVDPTMTSSGMMWPGMRVDVFVTYQSVDRRIGTEIATVLEDVTVFAVDNTRDVAEQEPSEIKAKTISLLVTPEEAMRLKRAENMGKLHVAMRGQDDATHVNTALRFDDVNRPFQHLNEQSEDEGEGEQGVQTFLDQQTGEQPVADAETVEPERPMWKIHIFANGEERIEEVALPESHDPAAQAVSVSAVVANGPSASNPLLGYLKKVLGNH